MRGCGFFARIRFRPIGADALLRSHPFPCFYQTDRHLETLSSEFGSSQLMPLADTTRHRNMIHSSFITLTGTKLSFVLPGSRPKTQAFHPQLSPFVSNSVHEQRSTSDDEYEELYFLSSISSFFLSRSYCLFYSKLQTNTKKSSLAESVQALQDGGHFPHARALSLSHKHTHSRVQIMKWVHLQKRVNIYIHPFWNMNPIITTIISIIYGYTFLF